MKKCKCSKKICMNRDLDLVSRFTCNLCNKIYCPSHRLYEKHDCSVFNLKKNNSQLFSGEMEKYLILHNMNRLFDKVVKNSDTIKNI